MLRLLTILLICFTAVPSMAQQQFLSPEQFESLPFEASAPQNTQPLMIEINQDEMAIDTHDGKKAGLPQFDVTTFSSQLFWLAISFTLLYVFFSRYALPSLSSTIEERRLVISNDLKEADALSGKVEKTRADYEQAMQLAYNDARLAIVNTEQYIREQADIQAQQFKEKSAAAVHDLEQQSEMAKAKIKGDLKEIAQDLTGDVIKKLTELSISDAVINKAVSELMDSPSSQKNKKAA
jgi:F-type H+-transporting ATPase subunit b